MPEVITDSKSAVNHMAATLEEFFDKGWQVVSIVEQSFSGELRPPDHHDVGVCDPKNVTVAHFYLPHGDHFHEWVIILAKAELSLSKNTLGKDFLTLLKMMDMDEQSSVAAVGHA